MTFDAYWGAAVRWRMVRKALALQLLWLAPVLGWAEAFRSQTLTIPVKSSVWSSWRFSGFGDVDGDGRLDLLAIDPAYKKVWLYRQRPAGFPAHPDQTIDLPPQTAWVALGDVAPEPGPELLAGTTAGVVYFPQQGGRFEPLPSTLISSPQVFAGSDPVFAIFNTNREIPLVSKREVVLWRADDSGVWKPGPALPLPLRISRWRDQPGEWMLGTSPAYDLRIERFYGLRPRAGADTQQESESVRRILRELEAESAMQPHDTDYLDLNGDGRPDLVFWRLAGDLDPRTDLFIFLRGQDGQLPPRPTQVLHCRGFPVSINSEQWPSPFCDLDGDGDCELVLVVLKTTLTSSSGMVEMVVSRGLDCMLTVRKLTRAGYSRSPDASLELTTGLPGARGLLDSFLLEGDFNGDRRRDLLVRRTPTLWDLYLSTTDGRWFAPNPATTLEIASPGWLEARDLDGDGTSDLVVHPEGEPRLVIFFSQSRFARRP